MVWGVRRKVELTRPVYNPIAILSRWNKIEKTKTEKTATTQKQPKQKQAVNGWSVGKRHSVNHRYWHGGKTRKRNKRTNHRNLSHQTFTTIDVPSLGTVIEQNGDRLLEDSLMPVRWPLHLDGCRLKMEQHRTATFQELITSSLHTKISYRTP